MVDPDVHAGRDHPELATWEGLKTDATLFKTAESGSAGQILDGDPSFVTFDQPIADNLGLNLKVVYAGSEAAELAALKTAYPKQGPILMYFWTPHWAQSKYDLTMIKLPAVTPACSGAAANDTTEVRVRATRRTTCTRRSTRICRRRRPRRSRSCRAMYVHERRPELDRARHQQRG